jgi:predicted dehydrogenase
MESSSSQRLSRRRFLAGTAAVLGAPTIITTQIRAKDGKPAANDRITIGYIGTGKRGHTLMRGIRRRKEVQVVAVSDVESIRRASARNMAQAKWGKGVEEYGDFRDLLARKDIDAVVIATPDHWHAIPIIAAAKAGKDVYCEKPLTLTIEEARVVVEVARQHKTVFQTGSQQRSECGGRFHRACELVRNGRLGKIHTVHVGVGGPSVDCDLPEEPCPKECDWNTWLGPTPLRGYNHVLCPVGVHGHYPAWRSYKPYSGGGMTDFGAHHFDIAQWGLGMDKSGPVEIIPPDGKEHKTLTYKYQSGVVMYHGGANGVKFTGPDGWIEVNRGHLHASDKKILEEKIGDDEIRLYKASNQLGNWVECIQTRKDPICPAEVGARSVTVCHLGNLAFWNKRPLKWDPAKWEFPGDAEANSWRDRERRAPWKLDA